MRAGRGVMLMWLVILEIWSKDNGGSSRLKYLVDQYRNWQVCLFLLPFPLVVGVKAFLIWLLDAEAWRRTRTSDCLAVWSLRLLIFCIKVLLKPHQAYFLPWEWAACHSTLISHSAFIGGMSAMLLLLLQLLQKLLWLAGELRFLQCKLLLVL